MAEKRKSKHVWLLKKQGKAKSTLKVELFEGRLWIDNTYANLNNFRIRINGKWFNNKKGKIMFFTKSEFRDILFKSIKF